MSRVYQQTVEAAIRADTGEILHANDLFQLSGEEFVALRRAAMRDREGLNPNGARPTLTCWVCGTRLWLSRRRQTGSLPGRPSEPENRFFRHESTDVALQCPWYDPSRYTKEQLLALRFHGQREGRLHRALKSFLARCLSRDPSVSDVVVEKVQAGQVLKGEWKKPDVRCRFGDRNLVFELQVSYTFISEVVKRDAFYQAERSFVIWVFAEHNEERAVVVDERYYNKRNLFVLDQAARDEGDRREVLVLHCYYSIPRRVGDSVCNEFADALVTLETLQYPEDTYRPHYFDYDAAVEAIQAELRSEREQAAAERRLAMQDLSQRVHRMPRAISEPPSVGDSESPVVAAGPKYKALTDALLELGRRSQRIRGPNDAVTFAAFDLPDPEMRRCSIAALEYPRFHALVRLIGIAEGVPVMTQRTDVFEMLANVLQPSATTQRQFAFLYCAAWLVYRPWIRGQVLARRREEIQRAVDAGDSNYAFDADFAALCAWLLPRLARSVRLRSLCGDLSVSKSVPRAWTLDQTIQGERVKRVGSRYMVNDPLTHWRGIYSDALAMRKSGRSFHDAVVAISKGHKTSSGDVFAFLSDCFT